MSASPTGGGILSGLFSSLGASIASSPDVAAAENTATQAFYAIAGELAVIVVLLALILAKTWDR